MAKEILKMGLCEKPRDREIILVYYLGEANVITKVFIRGRQEGWSKKRRCNDNSSIWRKKERERFEGDTLLAPQGEEGAMSQRMQAMREAEEGRKCSLQSPRKQ